MSHFMFCFGNVSTCLHEAECILSFHFDMKRRHGKKQHILSWHGFGTNLMPFMSFVQPIMVIVTSEHVLLALLFSTFIPFN